MPNLKHLDFSRRFKISTYILMKILESAPGKYDVGIRILTLGRLDRAYDRLISHVKENLVAFVFYTWNGPETVKKSLIPSVLKLRENENISIASSGPCGIVGQQKIPVLTRIE